MIVFFPISFWTNLEYICGGTFRFLPLNSARFYHDKNYKFLSYPHKQKSEIVIFFFNSAAIISAHIYRFLLT